MCVVGYYAEYFATTKTVFNTTNGTEVFISRDTRMQFHIKNLTFVGPIFMGIGAFIIVVACVVVFETRDKVLDIMEEQKRTAAKKRPDFYDLIVAQMKKKEEDILRGGVDNHAFEGVEAEAESEATKQSCSPLRLHHRAKSPNLVSTSGAIGLALRNISSRIFTIDIGSHNTLLPVPALQCESKITGSPVSPIIIRPRPQYGKPAEKYPSVSCIHDIMKARDPKKQTERRHSWLDYSGSRSSTASSKYEVTPLDIPLPSLGIDASHNLVNSIGAAASEPQSKPGIESRQEVRKSASFSDRKSDKRQDTEGTMGVSSDEEIGEDAMSTRDSCVSPIGQDELPIKEPEITSSSQSSTEPHITGRSVSVLVHQAPSYPVAEPNSTGAPTGAAKQDAAHSLDKFHWKNPIAPPVQVPPA